MILDEFRKKELLKSELACGICEMPGFNHVKKANDD